MRKVTVAATTFVVRPYTSVDDFRDDVTRLAAEASTRRPHFLLLPELMTTGFCAMQGPGRPDQLWQGVARFTEDVVTLFTELARKYGMHVMGSYLSAEGGKYFNIGYLCTPKGDVRTYRKVHLFPIETELGQTPGDAISVIETEVAKVAFQICYDVQFPEMSRLLALQGAEIIFCPSYTFSEQAYWRIRHCCEARAIEDDLFVVLSSTIGGVAEIPGSQTGFGRAAVFGPSDLMFPRAGLLAEGMTNQHMVVTAELDMQRLYEYREKDAAPHLRDRRPDLYRRWSQGLNAW